MTHPILLPCPTCSGTRTDTHEDRHTKTRQDICRTCGDTGVIPARTGETPDASFRPEAATNPAEASRVED